MVTIILALVAIIALGGWLLQYISTATLVWYLTEKGFPSPSDAEMKKGSRWVVSHLLSDLTGRSGKH